jgi:HEAT repeat protein
MILKFRDGTGIAHTEALAGAIPKLGPTMQKKAREALAERLTRMTSATLADKLRDDRAEIRRAAALAAAMKEDKGHLPRLIDLLEDADSDVARAAHRALKSLVGQDFGPAAGATPAERSRAIKAWREWLSKHPDQ